MAHPTPLRIAHGYGNSQRGIEAALNGPVDMIEADVWYKAGRILIQHERSLPLVPILYGLRPRAPGRYPLPRGLPLARWQLRLGLNPLLLEHLIEAVGGRLQMLLDLKGPVAGANAKSFADRLAAYLRDVDQEGKVRVCGNWPLLDAVRRNAPEIKVHYSVGGRQQYEALLLRLQEGDSIRGISIHASLLDEDNTRFMLDKGIEVYSWPADDIPEARRLIALGVGGIISYDLDLLGLLPLLAAEANRAL